MAGIPILTASELPSGESSQVMSLGEERRDPLRINARTATAESASQFAERITGIGRKIQEADRVRQYTQGKARAVKEFAELSSRYQSADFIRATKPGEYQKRFEEDLSGIRDRVFDGIDDQKARESLEASFTETTSYANQNVVTLARGRQINEGEAVVADSVLMNRERAIRAMLAGNTTEMQRATVDASEAIAGAEASGILTPGQAFEYRQKYATQVQEGFWSKKIYDDPETAWKELQALGSGGLPEGMTQDQYVLKLEAAKNATLAAEEKRYRDESREESKRTVELNRQQDQAAAHFTAGLYSDKPPTTKQIMDAVDIGMISGDHGASLLKLQESIDDEKRNESRQRESDRFTRQDRARAAIERDRVDRDRQEKENQEIVAANIFLEINNAAANGLDAKEEMRLRNSINLALTGADSDTGTKMISLAQAKSLQGEIDSLVKERFSNPEWQSAANTLKASMGVKSDIAPDYNAEKDKAYQIYLYRMKKLVNKGMSPKAALESVMPEAIGTKTNAETKKLVDTYSKLLPQYRTTIEGWAAASLTAIEAELNKINAERQQAKDGKLPPERTKFANFLKALQRSKESAQRTGNMEIE